MEKVLNYVAPVVEIVEVKVERGYAGSDGDTVPPIDSGTPGGPGWG